MPALFCLTDPNRTPDLIGLARSLPARTGLIVRTFGLNAIRDQTAELVKLRHEAGGLCLIAAEPELALQTGADGVHWPERWLSGANVQRSPGLISTSAHSPRALSRASVLADFAFVSTAFPSESPSAGRPMGVFRLAAYAQRSDMPVYALGGINTRTVKRLEKLGISGVGAIGALSESR